MHRQASLQSNAALRSVISRKCGRRASCRVAAVAAPVDRPETDGSALSQQAAALEGALRLGDAVPAGEKQPDASTSGRVVLESADELKSTWEHRVWVGGTSLLLGGVLASGLAQVHDGGSAAVAVASALAAYVSAGASRAAAADAGQTMVVACGGPECIWHRVRSCPRMPASDFSHSPHRPPPPPHWYADFGSAVYHWAVDNYGDGNTPLVGSQIAAFQGHHQRPWTITEREFCNNVHKVGVCGCGSVGVGGGEGGGGVTITECEFCNNMHKVGGGGWKGGGATEGWKSMAGMLGE